MTERSPRASSISRFWKTPDFAGWTVVDFKTDLEFELGRAEYSAFNFMKNLANV
jgi:hypothetical protein